MLTPLSIRAWLMTQPTYRDVSSATWAWIHRQMAEAFKHNTYRVWTTDNGRIVAVITWKYVSKQHTTVVESRQWCDHYTGENPTLFVTNYAARPGFDIRHVKRLLRSLPVTGIMWFREDKQFHHFPRQHGKEA